MSTLKTNTLSNVAGTASTAIENAINGSAKAWVNFNGTGTVAIRASYNVSSITDNATGNYTINFTTAVTDANYAVTGMTGSWNVANGYISQPNPLSTTQFQFRTVNAAGTADVDFPYVYAAIFR
jgi:hypothetical protein